MSRHPATRGIKVTHKCGHISNHRVSLGQWASSEKTPTTINHVEQLIHGETILREGGVCLDCSARQEYVASRDLLSHYFSAFQLDTPKELRGSIREKAWGESVRLGAVRETVDRVLRVFLAPSLGLTMFTTLYGKSHADIPVAATKLVNGVRKRLDENEGYSAFFNTSGMDMKILGAASLATRYALLQFNRQVSEYNTTAKSWGLWGKYRNGGYRFSSFYASDPYLVLNTFIALDIVETDSLEELTDMLDEMFDYYPKRYEKAISSFIDAGETPYQSIELVKVQRTLENNDKTAFTPPF